MSESNIFFIREIPSWQGLTWSVTWPGRGFIQTPEHIKTVWDTAFGTGAFSVGFSIGRGRSLRVDCIVYETGGVRALEHFVKHELAEVDGVAFAYHEEAQQFATEMEKIIMWNILKKDNAEYIFR